MRHLNMFGNWFRSLFHRHRAETELAEEFQDHLEREIESNLRAGMTAQEARLAALRLVGPVSYYQEQCRDWRSTAFLEVLMRDLRYGFHMLRRTPLFTVAAVLTLAVGIGANTTVFTFLNDIVLRQPPVRNPRQLAFLNYGDAVNISYPNYADLRDRNRVFSGLVAYRYNPVSMSIQPHENYRVWGYEASGNYFAVLGLQPFLGRFFTPAEDGAPGANPVMVISYRFWQSRLSADARAIGRKIKINGFPFTIIGVAPPEFLGTEFIVPADYWVPMSMELLLEPGNDWLHRRISSNIWVLGRLKPGISNAQAEADLNRVGRDLARTYPTLLDGKTLFHLSPPGLVGNALRGPISGFGVVLMSVAGLVLLLACVNLAGMLVARAADRRREIAIRLAIGASKGRLLRQLLTESLILATLSGAVGFAIAFGVCRLFSAWRLEMDIPFHASLRPDGLVLCFTAAIALATTLLFGLLPAVQAIRTDLIPGLKNAPANRIRSWNARDLIVTGQIAISVILVICSVLVVRSLQHALSLKLGFEPDHAVSASFDLRLQGYDSAHSRTFDAALVAKAAALPGIEAAGIINNPPLRIGGNYENISRAGRPLPPPSERRSAIVYNISPGYFKAAGTRLLVGRDIDDHDRQGAAAVAVVNQTVADLLFPGENPVGKHCRMSLDASDPGVEIVGVVEAGKYESLGEDPHPAVFLPIAQTGTAETTLVLRTPLPPREAADLIRKAILDLDPELTLFNVGTLTEQLALPLFPARAAAIVLGVFGLLAMILAATGLFALMAYTVARRTREIGIRMALGARPNQVLCSVLRRTLALCTIGVAMGALVTVAVGKVLSAVLYGVSPRDPLTYATAILLMALVALLACWNPANRAIRIDPARTLREE
jgi:predicted permease